MKKKTNFKQHAVHFKRFTRKSYAAFNSMKKVINIGVVSGSVLASMIISPCKAQSINENQQQKMIEEELEEVVVTAAKIETPLNETAKLATIITREQIERMPVQSIQDALVHIANIDVVQRGGHGVQADISIRGGSFDQNAILLNGINITNAHTGHYNFDIPINLSDIERIEIIHGPTALVYGAGTFSGGINIITNKKTNRLFYLKSEGGMYNLANIEARTAFAAGSTSHTLSIAYDRSSGYIKNSDYAIGKALYQSRISLPKDAKIDFQLGYNDKKYGANTFYSAKYPNQYESTSSMLASIKGETGGKIKLIPSLYFSRHFDRFELIKGSETGRNHHRNDAFGANLAMNYSSILGSSSVAAEIRHESIISSVLGKPMNSPQGHYKRYDARTNSSVTFEHNFTYRLWSADAGILFYYTDLTKKYSLYPSVNIAYRPSDQVKISASWSKSTRMPTFTDLYYTTETHNGNAGLRPETSESFDAGVHYTANAFKAYISTFILHGKDMIDWVKTNPQDAKWASWNHTKINTTGIETGLSYHPNRHIRLAADYSRMNQDADAQGLISIYSLNYLRDKFTAQIHHPLLPKLSAGWYFRYQKRMGTYEKYENSVKVSDSPFPAFSTLDLSIKYNLRNVDLYINLNNIYNTHYFDRGNIPQPGFWLIGGIEWKIDKYIR
jgi:iron complex outermembrane receptor protein